MDDDNRRGDSNMADADLKAESGNSDENKSDVKISEVENQAAGSENTCQGSASEKPVEEAAAASTVQEVPTESKDAEETKKQLASLREELNRAREASARAKDEVEKAKKDLADAKQDTAKMAEEKGDESKVESKVDTSEQEESISAEQPSSNQVEPQLEQTGDIQATADAEATTESISGSNQTVNDVKQIEEPAVANTQVEHESPSEQVETEIVLEQSREENGNEDAHSEHEDEEEVGSEEEHDEELGEEGEEEEMDEEEGEKASDDEAPAKPLDDDEDRRNPQYIPKRGGFYEHDDRTREEGEETVPEQPEVEEKPKKGMRSEVVERWGHDMFDETQQTPKSNHELVAVYGYDIRQEEGAPRARRRRRYGRGPNKYDRTWEDEEAYNRTRGRGTGRGGPSRGSDAHRQRPQRQETPSKEDFPPLSDQRKDSKPSSENAPVSDRGDKDTGSVERRADRGKSSAISFRRGGGGRTFEERGKPRHSKPRSESEDNQFSSQEADAREPVRDPRSPRGRGDSSRGGFASRGPRGGPSRGAGPSPRGRGSAGYRGGRQGAEGGNWREDEEPQQATRSAAHQHGSGRTFHGQQQNADNHRSYDSESRGGRGRGKFNRSGDEQTIVGGVEQMRIDSQPARHQDAARSKRYSSQRQRMTTPPPAAVPIPQYPAVGGNNSANYYTPYNDSPPPNYVQTAPGPMLPMAVAAQSAPPAYMGPPMYPTGPGPAPFPGAAYQGYPAAAGPPPVQVGVPIGSPTQDNMYGGGIMYYDPGRQHLRHGAQPPPQRRAKAAIPIVAPDGDHDSYMVTGRPSHHE